MRIMEKKMETTINFIMKGKLWACARVGLLASKWQITSQRLSRKPALGLLVARLTLVELVMVLSVAPIPRLDLKY